MKTIEVKQVSTTSDYLVYTDYITNDIKIILY